MVFLRGSCQSYFNFWENFTSRNGESLGFPWDPPAFPLAPAAVAHVAARCSAAKGAWSSGHAESHWYTMWCTCTVYINAHHVIYIHIILILYYVILYTSSTAQGGGGSFKNRKPIGELGCCESGMAERSHWWTERCLISLTLSLSFSDYLPAYLSIFYVSIYLSIFLV